MADTKHMVLLEGFGSSAEIYGEKDAFPVQENKYTDRGRFSEDNSEEEYRYLERAMFTIFPPSDGLQFDKHNFRLYNILESLRTETKPLKITLITLNNKNPDTGDTKSGKYYRCVMQEHDQATISALSSDRHTYRIKSDTATLGTGKNATTKNKIDFQQQNV